MLVFGSNRRIKMSDSPSQPYTAPYFIKYNPTLVAEFGSQNAALLFDRLEYWFHIKKNEFYKFIEPCKHPCYREGDSWSEELRFSKLVFRNAFDKIGIRYISKTAFEKEEDPFKGKLFASYRDRQSKKTVFVRNNSLVRMFYERLKGLVSKATKSLQKTFNPVKTQKKILDKNLPSRREGYRSSYAGATKDKQITTSSKKENSLILKGKEFSEALTQTSKIASDMKAVWIEEIGSRGLVNLTPEMSQRLERALEDVFQGSLADWQAHCRKIASSQFLMGEKQGTNYEIRLPVAITQKFQIQLEEGRFELKTRETNADKKKKAEYEKLRAKSVQRERIQERIHDLEREKADHEKRLIMRREKALSLDDIEKYKQTFECLMKESDCSKGKWFREKGWSDFSVKLNFQVFLWNKLKETLTKEDLERPDLDEKIEEFKQDMLIFSTKKAGGEKC